MLVRTIRIFVIIIVSALSSNSGHTENFVKHLLPPKIQQLEEKTLKNCTNTKKGF